MAEETRQPWWRELSLAGGEVYTGDIIIAEVGAGARGVVVGKNQQVTQSIYEIVGEPQPDDRELIEDALSALRTALQAPGQKIDPAQAAMAEFQLELLGGELTKTEEGELPSANTIMRVGEWLLEHVPSIGAGLTRLFDTPAVARVLAKAGDGLVGWIGQLL